VAFSRPELASLIDHSVLGADVNAEAAAEACRVGAEFGVTSVCVMPYWTAHCARLLKDSPVLVGVAVGFPFGSQLIACKALEARLSIEYGADEIDFAMNVGAVRSGDWGAAETDAREVIESVRAMEEEKQRRIVCKMILECCYLGDDEKREAAEMAVRLGADFVKTSTGFGPGGATVEDVALLREVVGVDVGVKAAGGIRTCDDVCAMVDAGASRIGTSSTVDILSGAAHTPVLREP